ncbi:Tm-1-like ATP-binding domain-containing protein [Phytohabitans sp. ZYX-F-186]|uniref:Tm-1-like ATP-binding domain-containing protein n=1 Tax=Phytohabitans maris TaxID=3071409 RepID=A0ABU0ZDY4_9ACTN|nr:Tm-1-like ATP-binding domain-containing protein [Phytohabitans sp. ZYX-F-186]MDQ7904644.1 Tm-1-like ATP-binding domain-containing protein [Phytohabitans sp. ZYX-F-186]
MTTTPTVAVVATMDTKGREAEFLSAAVRRRGVLVKGFDISLRSSPEQHGTKSEVMRATVAAAARSLLDLVASGALDGVVAVGGGTGSWLARHILASLPLGMPKVLLTTVPGEEPRGDVVEIPTIVDVAGLNEMLRDVLDRGAETICALVRRNAVPSAPDGRSALAQTMFGVTTTGGEIARRRLEDLGYEPAVFHANGRGGRDMEALIAQGRFRGVLDWTLSEITDELLGGICSAGAERLTAAGYLRSSYRARSRWSTSPPRRRPRWRSGDESSTGTCPTCR